MERREEEERWRAEEEERWRVEEEKRRAEEEEAARRAEELRVAEEVRAATEARLAEEAEESESEDAVASWKARLATMSAENLRTATEEAAQAGGSKGKRREVGAVGGDCWNCRSRGENCVRLG